MAVQKKSNKKNAQRKNAINSVKKTQNLIAQIRLLEKQISLSISTVEEKISQLECLHTFSTLMSATLNLDEIRQQAILATSKMIACQSATLLLVDRAKGELYWRSATESSGDEPSLEMRVPINDQTLAGCVAMNAESVMINHFQRDPRAKASQVYQPERHVNTVIALPLVAHGRVVGVLEALNKLDTLPPRASNLSWPIFYAEDLAILTTLAHQVSLAISNSLFYSEIQKNFFETVEALAEAIEKKDSYTGGHTKRVAHFAMSIARQMRLTPEQMRAVRLGAILHDVGKIGIDDHILKKDGSLNDEEWRLMKTHPQLGFEIMHRVEGMYEVTHGIRFHHERWDGRGYPNGLKGEEIPLVARVISVADAYDAMVSNRPYRQGIGVERAYDEIVKNQGTQFDPVVVQAFIQAFESGQMGRGSGQRKKQDQKNLKKMASSG